jgi:hypothetical protein
VTVSKVAAFSRGNNDDSRGREDVEICSSGTSGIRFAIAPDAAL